MAQTSSVPAAAPPVIDSPRTLGNAYLVSAESCTSQAVGRSDPVVGCSNTQVLVEFTGAYANTSLPPRFPTTCQEE
jgi:hypothetical protein